MKILSRKYASRIATPMLLLLLGGCIGQPSNPAATRPATDINPALATAGYWWDKPAAASAHGLDYDALWNAAALTARNDLFTIDRHDYRQGILSTDPLISRQFFEFWRTDALTPYDLTRSSLQNIRRTIRFVFTRDSQGGWTVAPKVLIEQFSTAGRRVTYVGAYQSFSEPGGEFGSTEADEGIFLPSQYWFAIGRDPVFEKHLAAQIQRRLDNSPARETTK